MSKKPKVILELEKEIGVFVNDFLLDESENLIELKIFNKGLKRINFLENLKTLQKLDLSYNNIEDFSPLVELTNLEVLFLSHNIISKISGIEKLINLKILEIRNNSLTDISPLEKLGLLGELDLRINNLTSIKSISKLIGLKKLYLNGNSITNIEPIKHLHDLKHLYIGENNLENINIDFPNLEFLDLSKNNISDISSLKKILNLKYLDLSKNNISEIDSLKHLIHLNYLDLSNNKIESIIPLIDVLKVSLIFNIEVLEKISPNALLIYNNLIDRETIKAIRSGSKTTLIKFLEAQERGVFKIPEAKMVLLGEPRAGKTTLQKYLMGLPINENEESTPDIQISSWNPFENSSEDKNKDIKINLWDFGGQEIQYSLHKLFMTEDTLYIIVLDSTKDQSPLKYLKFLENYAPNSPFIIINNYGDVPTSNTFKIDENYLRENYNGKEGMPVLKAIFNRVSVLKAAKLDSSFRKIMDEVEEAIKTELLNLKNLNKEFPKEYQLVKSAIEQEYSKPDKHYITMSYYRELCKSLNITDDEELRKAILGYLNEIGVLRYFKDSPITDRHILNPRWLIDGAYSLIIDKETGQNFGVLTQTQARNILKRSKKGFKFEEEESEFIFKTMKVYGLLYSDETEKKVYIPLKFNSLQPTTLLDFYENGKHFVFEFKTEIPEEIISNLIVEHFKEITQKNYWSKGAVFENNKVRILVKVEDRNIHFYVQGQFHQSYFEILRRTLRKSLERLPGLGYEEIVEFELNEKKIRVVYEYLVDVLTDKLGFYYDHATKTKINENDIVQILGGYFSSRQIEQITNVTNNNFYGTFNDNRYQQITIIQELNSLVQLAQNVDDRKALEEIRSEIQALNQTNEVEKKESLGKKLLGKIKQLSTDSLDDVVKDKLKELFPKIVEKGIDWVEKIDLDGIMRIFGGIL